MVSITQAASRRGGRPLVLIIADDLSGAADSAVACVERGLETVVALGEASDAGAAQALAIDADTRRLAGAAAAAETARLVRVHAAARGSSPGSGAGAGMLFKKIDSTLRGHIGAEIAALLAARRQGLVAATAAPSSSPRTVAVLAPAFPALARTTLAGRQHLDGVPLEQTDMWRRAGMSGSACLLDMMSSAGLTSTLVPIGVVRRGDGAIRAAMTESVGRADVLVCDAESDDDLAAVARASLGLCPDVVWAGSAGLVGHLIDAVGLTRRKAGTFGVAAPGGPLLFVVGSLSPISRGQAACLATEDVVVLTVEAAMRADAPHLAGLADRLAAALAAGRDVLIQSTTTTVAPSPAQAAAFAATLADLIAPCAPRIGGLFATGGETARAVLTAMGVTTLRLVAEIACGVPLSVALGPRSVPVVTKAGAFGDPATMLHCRRVLRQHGAAAMAPERPQKVRL